MKKIHWKTPEPEIISRTKSCSCTDWLIVRDRWLYDHHYCENGERIEPWKRTKSNSEKEREVLESLYVFMRQDGFSPPGKDSTYPQTFRIIRDYIAFLKGVQNADGSL